MKRTPQSQKRTGGYTLVELMVAVGVFGVAATMILQLQNMAANLYKKNTAVNLPFQELRNAVDRINRDIHGAISIPTLLDANFQTHTGLNGAAGVSFLLPAGISAQSSVYQVSSNAAAGQKVVRVSTGAYTPTVGQRLLVPTHQLSANITAVAFVSGTASSSNLVYNLTLDTNVPVAITVTSGSNTYNVIARIASVAAYMTVFPANSSTGELRCYKNISDGTYSVLARNITTIAPFNMPIQ
jgi:prepilin-type N-terminal cleavage/methylation domain-containing protein